MQSGLYRNDKDNYLIHIFLLCHYGYDFISVASLSITSSYEFRNLLTTYALYLSFSLEDIFYFFIIFECCHAVDVGKSQHEIFDQQWMSILQLDFVTNKTE